MLRAASNVFRTKVAWFHAENLTRIESHTDAQEGPIFIQSLADEKFASLKYKLEAKDQYTDKFPLLGRRKLIHDSLGRVHLKVASSGPAIVYLRAQKYNPTTIVTHISDLYHIKTAAISRVSRLYLMEDRTLVRIQSSILFITSAFF